MSEPDDMPLFTILEAQGESSLVAMYRSDLKLALEENARLREENAMLRFNPLGSQTEKLGKFTETRIAALNDKRGTTAIVNRSYEYNALGIPTKRTIQRQGKTRQDNFTHNERNELTAATMGDKAFAYAYDNIGKAPEGSEGDWTNLQGLPRRGEPPMGWRRVNRKTAQKAADDFTYTANALNQYTQITENDTPFVPEFDADGNQSPRGFGGGLDKPKGFAPQGRGRNGVRPSQTRLKTTTGIWTATYNALNRPLTYTRENADGTRTVITAAYDKAPGGCKGDWTNLKGLPRRGEGAMGCTRVNMGRRVFKKVETVTPDSESGEETRTIITHHRYLYRGYLQIAALDLTRTTLNALWYITWDPTEPVATRPLAIQQSGTWYTYGIDLPKNITELYGADGYIKTTYTYSPYGLVTATGSVTQPIQWSSEYADTDLGLVYYNYRHYNPLDGRWTGRDAAGEKEWLNLYSYCNNDVTFAIDSRGLFIWFIIPIGIAISGTLASCTSTSKVRVLNEDTSVRYTLSYTIVGVLPLCCGEFRLLIKWNVFPFPPADSKWVIAQRISYSGSVTRGTKTYYNNQLEELKPFTEYWDEKFPNRNDLFSLGYQGCSKGDYIVEASAYFVFGAEVPASANVDMNVDSKAASWNLPTTKDSPKLNGIYSNEVKRRVVAKWDCSMGYNMPTILSY